MGTKQTMGLWRETVTHLKESFHISVFAVGEFYLKKIDNKKYELKGEQKITKEHSKRRRFRLHTL